MKYKNNTDRTLKFRAHDIKMEKVKFILKPGEEIELGKVAVFDGLELVKETKKVIKVKKTKQSEDE